MSEEKTKKEISKPINTKLLAIGLGALGVVGLVIQLPKILSSTVDSAGKAGKELLEGAGGAASDILDTGVEGVIDIYETAEDSASSAYNEVKHQISNAWEGSKDIASDAWNWISGGLWWGDEEKPKDPPPKTRHNPIISTRIIQSYYLDYVGRFPNSEELKTYIQQYYGPEQKNLRTILSEIQGFSESVNYLNQVPKEVGGILAHNGEELQNFLEFIYSFLLRREPDLEGLNWWKSETINNGWSYYYLFKRFETGGEYKGNVLELTSQKSMFFIQSIYQILLHRQADIVKTKFFMDRMLNGGEESDKQMFNFIRFLEGTLDRRMIVIEIEKKSFYGFV